MKRVPPSRRKFDIQIYIKSLAWKAFLKSKDPAIDLDDFIQEAQLALVEATSSYDGTRGTRLTTYMVSSVIFKLKKLNESTRPPCEELDKIAESYADFDYLPWDLKVRDVMSSQGNHVAKKLLTCLRENAVAFSRCSMAELRCASGLTEVEFQRALLQLARF